jgi:2-phospho-L-lactate guanylyltransferase
VAQVEWVVVVPVKPAARGKSRLAGLLTDDERADLVRAMALDTIAAARAASGVRRVVVVTADGPLRDALRAQDGPPVTVVDEPAPGPDPLNAAVRAGADAARRLEPDAGVAALLGDVPALEPDDLAAGLLEAARHERALVADAAGTGTTLVTAAPGSGLEPRFGTGSARAHVEAGHVRLRVPESSSVRHDVDVPADLRAVEQRGAGPRTSAWLARARQAETG